MHLFSSKVGISDFGVVCKYTGSYCVDLVLLSYPADLASHSLIHFSLNSKHPLPLFAWFLCSPVEKGLELGSKGYRRSGGEVC